MAPSNTTIPEDCPVWLAQWVGKTDERLSNIEGYMKARVEQNENPESKTDENKNDKISFKWIVEKIVVPGAFLLAGYLFGSG